jgi:hypothetical protein
MGANKTYQQKGDRGRVLGESNEFRRLRDAIDKAHSDRDCATLCRVYGVRTLDALLSALKGRRAAASSAKTSLPANKHERQIPNGSRRAQRRARWFARRARLMPCPVETGHRAI